MSDADEDTVDFDTDDDFAQQFFAPERPGFDVSFGAVSHIGKVRRSNDDHYAVIRRARSQEMLLSNLQIQPTLPDDLAHVVVVADGMGGQAFGEFASRVTLQMIFELAGRATSWLMKVADPSAKEIRQRVDAYARQMQDTLHHYARLDPQLRGMGTTCTTAYIMPPHVIVAHIGDSRAYHYCDGEFSQITRDHTLAQKMIDAGVPEESVRKFRNLLTNALGGDDPEVHAEVDHVSLCIGDQLLLCTDGLTNMVADDQIAEVLSGGDAPQSKCDTLLQMALDAGGGDNITVVLAEMVASESSSV